MNDLTQKTRNSAPTYEFKAEHQQLRNFESVGTQHIRYHRFVLI